MRKRAEETWTVAIALLLFSSIAAIIFFSSLQTNYWKVCVLIFFLALIIFFSRKISREVVARKKAEEQLRMTELELQNTKERYRSLIDHDSDVIMITDEKGIFLDVNASFCNLFGYSKEELIGSNVSMVIDPKQLKKDPVRFDVLLAGKSISRERRMMRKDGSILEVEVNVKMLFDGRMLAIARDITERKRAEEQLRESEQKYKLLFDSSPLPMFMFSKTDHSILDINEAAVKVYGFSRTEFLQMNVKDIRPTEDVQQFVDDLKMRASGNGHLGIWRHKKKDGSIIFVEIIGHNIIYKGIPGRVVIANDITEKQAYDEKLKQSFQEIRLLTKHLQNIREEERTHIAREIHDELGQQLTVLKMDVSWLTKKLSSADDQVKEKLRDLLDILDTSVKSVRRISSELRPSLLDDLGLIAAMQWHLKEFEKRSDVKTKFIADETELSLSEEIKTGLFRIFQESMTNVARHSGAKEVIVYLKRSDGQVVMRIEDDGSGFDRQEVGNKKTLGILGMEERSSMMGGNYVINSIPGEGTSVEVSVPLKLELNS